MHLPLGGVPISIKDVINVKGHPCGCASKILQGYVAPYDATVIAKLRAAGAIPFGRVNMDEFAMGSSTENSAFGPTRNPWDITRTPGGSSGGSAAVVAADEAFAALGSDTGRFDPSTGCTLRSGRSKTDLWSSLALRPGRICLFSGSNRPDHQRCAGRGDPDECYRRT